MPKPCWPAFRFLRRATRFGAIIQEKRRARPSPGRFAVQWPVLGGKPRILDDLSRSAGLVIAPSGATKPPRARRPRSAWERGDPRKLRLRRLLFRCLDGERDVCGPSFQPVAGIELVVTSEIEVCFAVRDGKEKSDLWPNSRNA